MRKQTIFFQELMMCSMSCSLGEPNLNMNVINTLGQAATDREVSYNVEIVDIDGVERIELNVANIPACEILGIECVDGFPKDLRRVGKKGVSKRSSKRRGGVAHT